MLWARSASGDYPVLVGHGVLAAAPRPRGGRPFVVTDETVGALYGGAVAGAATTIAIPPGEAAKTWEQAGRVLRALAAAGMDHDDHVVALGGGVVGDLAGFCAATYQRGVPVVQVPTTLVAQVDSAYGGKTGVDLPEGKNYAGAYHQPAAVLADPAVLATLPAAELAAGWAEVVKTALIAGGPLWERVRRPDAEVDADLVLACARTKLAVVAEDERDAGRRQVLNLGHTRRPRDRDRDRLRALPPRRGGRARAARRADALRPARAARRGRGAARRRAGCRRTLDPAVDRAAVLAALQRDKKRRGGRVGFVLVEAPGDVRTGRAVEPDDVARALGELGALMRNRVAVMHGVNLDALDRRPAEHYGGLTFARLEFRIEQFARELGLEARFFQTNHEGEFVEELHLAGDYADGLLLNPGAWTHYAWSIRDALEITGLPAVEVHLSDVKHREAFRARLGARGLCVATVSGQGVDGYRDALERLKAAL